jgi:hypothetical protein
MILKPTRRQLVGGFAYITAATYLFFYPWDKVLGYLIEELHGYKGNNKVTGSRRTIARVKTIAYLV